MTLKPRFPPSSPLHSNYNQHTTRINLYFQVPLGHDEQSTQLSESERQYVISNQQFGDQHALILASRAEILQPRLIVCLLQYLLQKVMAYAISRRACDEYSMSRSPCITVPQSSWKSYGSPRTLTFFQLDRSEPLIVAPLAQVPSAKLRRNTVVAALQYAQRA